MLIQAIFNQFGEKEKNRQSTERCIEAPNRACFNFKQSIVINNIDNSNCYSCQTLIGSHGLI